MYTRTKYDSRKLDMIKEDHERADTYATKGSVQHLMLRLGYFPNNEEDAEAIFIDLLSEKEQMEDAISKAKLFGLKELDRIQTI